MKNGLKIKKEENNELNVNMTFIKYYIINLII